MLIGYLKFLMKSLVIKTVILSVSFKELKNKLFYDCKKCRKEQLTPMNELIETFSNTY